MTVRRWACRCQLQERKPKMVAVRVMRSKPKVSRGPSVRHWDLRARRAAGYHAGHRTGTTDPPRSPQVHPSPPAAPQSPPQPQPPPGPGLQALVAQALVPQAPWLPALVQAVVQAPWLPALWLQPRAERSPPLVLLPPPPPALLVTVPPGTWLLRLYVGTAQPGWQAPSHV